MDVDPNTESVKADDTEQISTFTDMHDRIMREAAEVLLEIKTICNNTVISKREFVNNSASEHSTCVPSQKFTKNSLSDNSSIQSDFDNHSISYVPELKSSNENNAIQNENPAPHLSISCLKRGVNSVVSSHCSTSDNREDFYLISQNVKQPNESNNDNKSKDFNEFELHQESNSNGSNESLDDARRALRRNSKRKKEYDGYCPVCGVTVRLNDLTAHFNQEVEKLSKISKTLRKPRHEELAINKAFEQIKNNRENRLTARVARYSARAKNEVKCPVCSLRMSGTEEEINKHVAYCIQDEDSDEMLVVDDDDEDDDHTFEEYEFGDQRRIRTISLVEGGYRSLQGQSTNRTTTVDEDLNVDVDDTFAYGEPQYSELDVIPNATCEKDKEDLDRLRKAVLGSTNIQPNILEDRKWHMINEIKEETSSESKTIGSDVIVSSLKEKIKDLEDQNRSVKCLICLEPYSKPLVSTTCWHVHCEECWLMTMGVKKLCPQCNMIVFPSDLRKIYL